MTGRQINDAFAADLGWSLLGWIAATVGGRWADPSGAVIYVETKPGTTDALVRDFIAWGRDADATDRMRELGALMMRNASVAESLLAERGAA